METLFLVNNVLTTYLLRALLHIAVCYSWAFCVLYLFRQIYILISMAQSYIIYCNYTSFACWKYN